MSSKKTDSKTNGIKVIFILEIVGRPKEHLVKTLDGLIEAINKEKGIKVIEKKINEPIELKNNKDTEINYRKLAEAIKHGFKENFNFDIFNDKLNYDEIMLAKKLREEKYETEEWNYGFITKTI